MNVIEDFSPDGIAPFRTYADLVEREFGAGTSYVSTVLLLRAERELSRTIEGVLARFGFSIRLWTVLTTLDFAEGRLALGKMAKRLKVHATTITNAVDQLSGLGYAEREFDEADRRVIYASITSSGRRKSREMMTALAEVRFGWMGFDDVDLELVNDALHRFLE